MRDLKSEYTPLNGRRFSDKTRPLTDFGLPAFLQEINGVVIVLFAQDGQVLATNRDFLQLVPPPVTPDHAWNVRTLFLNPCFEDLRVLTPHHGDALLLYRGLLRLGHADQPNRSLQGHIYRWQQERLLVAAEYDAEGLEKLGATVLQLNKELAKTQWQLLQTRLELRRNEILIRELMNTDPLTGVGNQRRLDEMLITESERSWQHRYPLCLLITNLDYFKGINDRYNRATSDEALKRFAALLCEYSRQSDQVIRFCGEKFAVLLPDTVLESAVSCAERIRQRLEQQPLVPKVGRTTASFGVAMLAVGEKGEDLQRRAEQALSRSQKEGRNRITQAIAPGQVAAPDVSSC